MNRYLRALSGSALLLCAVAVVAQITLIDGDWEVVEIDGQYFCQRTTGELIDTGYRRGKNWASARCVSFELYEGFIQTAEAVSIRIARCPDGTLNMADPTCVAASTPTAPALSVQVQGADTLVLTLTTDCTGGTTPYTYHLWRSTTPSNFAEIDASADFSDDTYADANLAAATEYFYFVNCVDSAGSPNTSDNSNIVSATTDAEAPSDTTDPVDASNLSCGTETDSTIPASWTIGTDNVAVTTQRIYAGLGDGMGVAVPSSTFLNQDIGLATSFNITGLDADQEYYYRIDTFDAAGNSNITARQFCTTDSGTPDPSVDFLVEITFESQANGTNILSGGQGGSYAPESGSDPGFYRGAYQGASNVPVVTTAEACEGTKALELQIDDNNGGANNSYRSSFELIGGAAGGFGTNWQGTEHWLGWAYKFDPNFPTNNPGYLVAMQFHGYNWIEGNIQDSPVWATRMCGTSSFSGSCPSSASGEWRMTWENNTTGGPNLNEHRNFGQWSNEIDSAWHNFEANVVYDVDGQSSFTLWMDDVQVADYQNTETFNDTDVNFGYYVPGLYNKACGQGVSCGNQKAWIDSFRIADGTATRQDVRASCN